MRLIVPCAGNSSRFPGTRPKYLLTLPDGRLMIEHAVSGINLSSFDSLVIAPRDSHLNDYIDADCLASLFSHLPLDIQVVPVCHTTSQVDTVSQVLTTLSGDFPFAVKDSDNSFHVQPAMPGLNAIAYIDLNISQPESFMSPAGKCYLEIDSLNNLRRITEKQVISSKFACGYYQFASTDSFLEVSSKLLSSNVFPLNESLPEVYLSHVIFDMLLASTSVSCLEASCYQDMGDVKAFREISDKAITIFCDFDGVLVENSSKFASPPWSFVPLVDNIDALKTRLHESDYSQLVITTSRPSDQEAAIFQFLESYGLTAQSIVSGLPHCKRLLVNDFSSTNSYPSARSVNLPRDSQSLSHYL